MTEGFNPAIDGPNATHIKFYRVQNIEGYGPYTSMDCTISGRVTLRHPSPHSDGLDLPWAARKLYRFGFRSWTQLHAWMMPEILQTLEDRMPGEWSVIEYELSALTVLHGAHQSMALAASLESEYSVRKYTLPVVIGAFPKAPEMWERARL